MRIIISENKLDRVISKWLSKNYSELDIYDRDHQPWHLYVNKDGEVIFLYQNKEKELYVANNVIKFLYLNNLYYLLSFIIIYYYLMFK